MGNRAKIREKVKMLNPIDDTFFQVMAEDKRVCQEILRTVLGEPELIVMETKPQRELRNLQGRSVRLDAENILESKKHALLELQKADDDDHQKRVRYNGACLTVNITDPGVKFKNVPDVISVFITKFDIFKAGCTTYHIDRVVRESGERAENGFTEVYVNAEADDGTDAAQLMNIFVEDNCYDDIKFPCVSKVKRFLKESEKGVNSMTDWIQEMMDEERAEGRMEGKILAYNMMGMSSEEIADKCNIAEEYVKKVLDENLVGV